MITSQGKPTGLISRAAVVRWFLENRWTARKTELDGGGAAKRSGASTADGDATLLAMTDQLISMAHDLRKFLRGESHAADPAPIVGGASRMQELLDDLLTGYARRDSTDRGLPS